MQLRKPDPNDDEKEIKDLINKNIASPFKTQQPFAELLLLNGCPKIKLGLIGSKIRKELLYEAENGDLTPDTVMPRAYELIGKFLKISEVTTFDYIGIENSNHEIISKKENKKLLKQKDIEEKFGVDLTNKQWFQCSIEEIKYSTFSNQPQRNIDHAYVIINEDNFEIIKFVSIYISLKIFGLKERGLLEILMKLLPKDIIIFVKKSGKKDISTFDKSILTDIFNFISDIIN